MRATYRKVITPGKRVRFVFETALFQVAGFVVRLLPRSAACQLGRALGWLVYQLSPRDRRISRANLDIAFGDTKPPAEKRRIACAALQNAAATLTALLWAPRLREHNYRQYVEFSDADLALLAKLKADGRGVIFLTMHYGDWELTGLATGFVGHKLTIVAKPLRNASLQREFVRLREFSGHQIIPQRGATRALLHALREGGGTALLNDLNARHDLGGVWVDFFGLPVFNNSILASLALHTGAPIVFGCGEPLGGGRIRTRFEMLEFTPTGDREADTRALTQRCMKFCEDVIRARPDLWLWNYRRWHNRPTAELGRYPFYSRYIA
jgi:KDO2-lipid IV(A) lauroyltransferase